MNLKATAPGGEAPGTANINEVIHMTKAKPKKRPRGVSITRGLTNLEIYHLAMAAGWDAANRSMRKAGRTSWNDEDHDVCCDLVDRLLEDVAGPWNPRMPHNPDWDLES